MALKKILNSYNIASQHIAAVLLVFLITFPQFIPSFGTGLDNSYIWAFNYLFVNDSESLRQLVYPVGPLGFLKFPITEGNNLAFAIAFYSLLKIWFSVLFIILPKGQPGKLRFTTALLLLCVSWFLSLDFLIIGVAVMHTYIMIEHRRWWHLVPASMIAATGLLIKASIGIAALSAIFAGWVFYAGRFRNLKESTTQLASVVAVSVVLCAVVSGGITNCIVYSINALRLSFSYSEALALFPENNKWLLAGFIFTLSLIPLTGRPQTRRLFLLLILPAFAMWKYGLGRQDIYHYAAMLQFFIVFWGFIILLNERFKLRSLLLALVSISLLYSNMHHVREPEYRPLEVEINGVNHFREAVIRYTGFKIRHTEITTRNLAESKIPDEIRATIGEASVDVYPWELTLIPANNLNWKPRTTLQSGSFARWIDRRNADDFNRENGPEFLIFHFVKDTWGGDFGSIDGRYLLNDNPLTIVNILNYYNLIQKTGKFLLFRKNDKDRLNYPDISEQQQIGWNQWIDVPEYSGEILRIKVIAKTTLKGKWVGFWYKTSPTFIDYRFEDGKIMSYRFIPENARDGIWINPFIRFPANNIKESKVKSIRFRADDARFMQDRMQTQFEFIRLADAEPDHSITSSDAEYLFSKTQVPGDSLIFSMTQVLDTSDPTFLSKAIPGWLNLSGNKSAILEGQDFSLTWRCKLEELWTVLDSRYGSLLFETDVFYQNSESEVHLVISLSESENDFWIGQKLPQNPSQSLEYQYAFANRFVQRNENPAGVLAVYVWNSGSKPVSINNFRISIKAMAYGN